MRMVEKVQRLEKFVLACLNGNAIQSFPQAMKGSDKKPHNMILTNPFKNVLWFFPNPIRYSDLNNNSSNVKHIHSRAFRTDKNSTTYQSVPRLRIPSGLLALKQIRMREINDQ